VDLSYWDSKIGDWKYSGGLMVYFTGNDIDFWEITKDEADTIVESIKKEKVK
jgi:hypothetical protein